MRPSRSTLTRLWRYGVSGGVAAVVAWGISWWGYQKGWWTAPGGQLIGFLAGSVVSFVLNRQWAFQNRYRYVPLQILIFVGVSGIGLGINEMAVMVATHMLHIWVALSMAIGIGTAFVWNFTVNNWITFGKLS